MKRLRFMTALGALVLLTSTLVSQPQPALASASLPVVNDPVPPPPPPPTCPPVCPQE